MRFDRALTLLPFRKTGAPAGEQLPVLMYHSVSEDPESGVGPYYRVATSPQRFAEQMQWLGELGYRGVALEDALDRPAAKGGGNGERLAAITFDDGFRDFHTAAWPVLQRHRFTATMYLPTAFVSAQRKSFRDRECLTWDEVRKLNQEGARFGSHTVNHPKLYELSWPAIETELTRSRAEIEQELGQRISSFAYPFAFPQEDRDFVERFEDALRKAGYDSCATTVIGRARPVTDTFLMKRLPINSCDDRALFAAKLAGGYDWMGGPQAMVRRVKSWVGKTPRRKN